MEIFGVLAALLEIAAAASLKMTKTTLKINGQVSIEVMGIFGILFLLFIILLGIIIQLRIDVFETDDIIEQRTECVKLANLITWTFINGDGTSLKSNIKFNASINQKSRLISVKEKKEVFCNTIVSNVSEIDLSKGDIRIKNENESVILENA